jgi:hypothetical protein
MAPSNRWVDTTQTWTWDGLIPEFFVFEGIIRTFLYLGRKAGVSWDFPIKISHKPVHWLEELWLVSGEPEAANMWTLAVLESERSCGRPVGQKHQTFWDPVPIDGGHSSLMNYPTGWLEQLDLPCRTRFFWLHPSIFFNWGSYSKPQKRRNKELN